MYIVGFFGARVGPYCIKINFPGDLIYLVFKYTKIIAIVYIN